MVTFPVWCQAFFPSVDPADVSVRCVVLRFSLDANGEMQNNAEPDRWALRVRNTTSLYFYAIANNWRGTELFCEFLQLVRWDFSQIIYT